MEKALFLNQLNQMSGITRLLAVVDRLRHPTEGCPWDLKQTHASLKPYMLEEAYEAVEAIDSGKPDLIKEELGDVLLQIALHSQLATEAGQFDFEAVCNGISDKLIRRHPHVFDTVEVDDAEAVTRNWEAIKKAEKGDTGKTSILTGVSKQQPALSQALETSKRAVKVGFEWPNLESLWECVMSEFEEFRTEATQLTAAQATHAPAAELQHLQDRLELEMGDIFFASVNLARHFKIDPETALIRATQKFTRRFQTMEALITERYGPDYEMTHLDFEAWDQLWNEAKSHTQH